MTPSQAFYYIVVNQVLRSGNKQPRLRYPQR